MDEDLPIEYNQFFNVQQAFRRYYYGIENKFNHLYLNHWWHIVPNEILLSGYTSHNHVKEEYDDTDFMYMNRILDVLYNKEDMNLYMKFTHTQNYVLIPDAGDFSKVHNLRFSDNLDDLTLDDIGEYKVVEENTLVKKVPVVEKVTTHHRQNMNKTETEMWLLKKNYREKLNKLKFMSTDTLSREDINNQIAALTAEMNEALDKLKKQLEENGVCQEKFESTKPAAIQKKFDYELEIINENYDDSTLLSDSDVIINHINQVIVDKKVINKKMIKKKMFHHNFENKIMEKYLKSLREKKILCDIIKLNFSQQINICLQAILDLPRLNTPIKAYLDIELKEEKADTRISHFLRARLYPCVNNLKLDSNGKCESLFQITIPPNFPVYVLVPDGNAMLTTFYLPYTTIRAGNKWNLIIRQHYADARNIEIDAYHRLEDGGTELQKVVVKRLKSLRFGALNDSKINNIMVVNDMDAIGHLISDFHDRIAIDPVNIDLGEHFSKKVFEYLKDSGSQGWNVRYLSDYDLNIIENMFGLIVRKRLQVLRDLFLFYKIHVPFVQ
jgi:hypothetical protein